MAQASGLGRLRLPRFHVSVTVALSTLAYAVPMHAVITPRSAAEAVSCAASSLPALRGRSGPSCPRSGTFELRPPNPAAGEASGAALIAMGLRTRVGEPKPGGPKASVPSRHASESVRAERM